MRLRKKTSTSLGIYPSFSRRIVYFTASVGLAFVLMVIGVATFTRKADTSEVISASSSSNLVDVGSVEILRLEAPIRAGTKLSKVSIPKRAYPKDKVPQGAFYDLSEVQSLYAIRDLQPGVPLLRSDTSITPIGVSLPLTPGNRAVSIEIDQTSGLEGHALPGTRVDVVLTSYQNTNLSSDIIVQNARVISSGGDTTDVRETVPGTAPRMSRTLTLDVSTSDALRIQTARQLGRLSLLMRAPEDNDASSVSQVTGSDVQGNRGKTASVSNSCSRGRIKMSGKTYILGCDGSMTAAE